MLRDASTSVGAVVRAEQPWGDAQLAALYDAFVYEADLPLYLELAEAQAGGVLEVPCGSGRVMLPLARAGHRVVGLDASPHMLDLARQKLEREANLDGRVRLQLADMREFQLPEAGTFGLAICAVKSFAYLTETLDQLRCLQSIAAHLRPGGLLALDLLHPRPEWIAAAPGSLRDDLLAHDPRRGVTLSRVESVVSTDLTRQLRVIRSAYEVIDDDGRVVAKRFVEWPYRWVHRYEAEHLLVRAGFAIEAIYGGPTREPFTSDSRSMLFLARKT